MGAILAKIKQEPVMSQGLVQAVMAFAVAFGLDMRPPQIASILALSAAVLSFVTRTQVTPTVNANPASGAEATSKAA